MPMSFQTRNTYLFSEHMSSLSDRLLPCTFHQKDLRAYPQEMCIYYSSTWQQLVTGGLLTQELAYWPQGWYKIIKHEGTGVA